MTRLQISLKEIENGFLVESSLRETVHASNLEGAQAIILEIVDEYKRRAQEAEEQRMLRKVQGHGWTLRDKMQIALSTFADLEKQLGIVEESQIYVAIARKLGSPQEVAKDLIEKLITEGILYSPKPGFIKRTAV